LVPFEDYALIEFALHHRGVVEPTPRLFSISSNRSDDRALAQVVADAVTDLMGGREFQRIGIGVVERADHRAVVVALQESYLEISPVPRQVAAGARVQLRGRLKKPFADPEVLVMGSGAVEEVEVRRTGQARFTAAIGCGADPVVRVEISGTSNTGSSVLANFPIYCGRAPPASLVSARSQPIDRKDVATAERRLVDLINRDRSRVGLPPLALDAAAAGVARQYSEEMARTGRVVHVSPISGSADDRLRRAGFPRSLVQENLAQATSPDEAHRNLMNSPGHRANILSHRATHVGVGVVSSASGLLVTELFTRILPSIDPRRARHRLALRVREALGVRIDSVLTKIAQTHAERMAARGGGTAQEIRDSTDLRKLARFNGVSAVVVAVSDVDGFGVDKLPRNAGTSHAGIGVAQGYHEALGEGAIYVVLLLGAMR
jgi:uncharacterized protein YkwD